MASLEKRIEKVQKMVEIEVEVQSFVLTLSLEEILVLRELVGNVTGRGNVKSITDKLYDTIENKIDYATQYLFTNSNEIKSNADEILTDLTKSVGAI